MLEMRLWFMTCSHLLPSLLEADIFDHKRMHMVSIKRPIVCKDNILHTITPPPANTVPSVPQYHLQQKSRFIRTLSFNSSVQCTTRFFYCCSKSATRLSILCFLKYFSAYPGCKEWLWVSIAFLSASSLVFLIRIAAHCMLYCFIAPFDINSRECCAWK